LEGDDAGRCWEEEEPRGDEMAFFLDSTPLFGLYGVPDLQESLKFLPFEQIRALEKMTIRN